MNRVYLNKEVTVEMDRLNCTPCQGHFYLFVLGNVCLSTLQLTIPSNG